MSDGAVPQGSGTSEPSVPPASDASGAPAAYSAPSYHWPFGEPDHAPAPASPRARRPGLAGVVALSTLTALVVGGGAGLGAARLSGPSGTGLSAGPASSAVPSSEPAPLPAGETASTVEVARRVLPGTVTIEVGSGDERGTGSGLVLDRDGHVLTNNHVVAAAATGARLRVLFSDGRQVGATLVGRSPSYDLAVVKVAGDDRLRPLELGSSADLRIGATVVAVGSPLGLPGTVTQGIVSAVDRPVVVSESRSADAPTAYIDGIQTDAAINPGNSGGPLVDASARVVGVSSAILTLSSGQAPSGSIGIGFAIPVDQARTIAAQLVRDGRATYPVIGAQLRGTSGGVELTGVDAGGPARRAGLRAGDLVSSLDDRDIDTTEELVVAVRTHRPGEQVRFGYARGTDEAEATVTLGGRVG